MSKKIFATNHDMGSAQAMAPALTQLAQQGYDVVAFGYVPDAPAMQVFRSAELKSKTRDDYPYGETMLFSVADAIQEEAPDLILVGVSVRDDGTEKQAITAAKKLGIPVAFIVETWPHRWLDVYGDRDIPLYSQAQLALVWDEVSKSHLQAKGFRDTEIVVTGNPSEDSFAEFKRDRDKHRTEMRQRFGIEEDAIVIQWSVALDLDDPEQDKPGHSEWSGFSERDSIREFLEALRICDTEEGQYKVRGVIRQKPSYEGRVVKDMIREICPSVIFDNGRTTGYPLILASDVVVGAVTMMVQNAAMFGVPALNYLPDLCKPVDLIANTLGFTRAMRTRGDLGYMVSMLKQGPGYLYSLQATLKPITLQTDATGNVTQAIRKFLGS